ncbi:NAD(P) transhydrogenase subunit alpha [Candidatus Photodesmus katoptron]|uniref:Re/Si-specific NAD(P)(+) transhydrogenase subunit alpha n=1 Tax=Candidatus Photodesmus anomalopis TaxID=28176 RepID=UPI0004D4203A|nr:Re/Si-specific NAD(P)(+) transhydrogenase subunit alpha [Candidatus Photodesmus katoptron]KEY90142.1 NAD(P) transhydrogenase subunit alpha [Candidatus Photodesmus katoptron]
MQVGIPKEIRSGEKLVSACPKSVKHLIELGFEVFVESKAGELANFRDLDYETSGARIVSTKKVWEKDIILKVNAPIFDQKNNIDEATLIKKGATLISFIWPAQNPELMKRLSSKDINVIAMDAVPRISKAQSLDALSSMANIAGYRAIIEASHQFGRFLSGQITAAGRIEPAKVLVLGVGVAGLSAIGLARSLGAIVRAFDVRSEVKEQVKSMGAEFLEINYQQVKEKTTEKIERTDGYATEMSDHFNKKAQELYANQTKDIDIIITSALIPGKPAPILITKDMVDNMKPGSVLVDLAASNGGNCEYTIPDKVVTTDNRSKVIGYTNILARLPSQSSELYATNILNLFKLLCKGKDGQISINLEDVILRSVTVIKKGEITWPAPPIPISISPTKQVEKLSKTKVNPVSKTKINPANPILSLKKILILSVLVGVLGWIAFNAPEAIFEHFTVLVLSCIIGYYVVWNVTYALHTPLMSVTNAISGIIIVGALLQIEQGSGIVTLLSFIAVLIASINIFGGFTITERMLKMFHKD